MMEPIAEAAAVNLGAMARAFCCARVDAMINMSDTGGGIRIGFDYVLLILRRNSMIIVLCSIDDIDRLVWWCWSSLFGACLRHKCNNL